MRNSNVKKSHTIYTLACAALMATLLLLAGCGGGGGTSSTAVEAPAPLTLSGRVTLNGAGLGQVSLSVTGSGSQFADGNGSYSFSGLSNGTHTITPSRYGYTFTPASQTVTIANNGQVVDFTATAIPSYTLSGTVSASNGNGLAGATVSVVSTATGAAVGQQTTDGSGHYAIAGVIDGNYAVTVSHADGYAFTPASQAVTVQDAAAVANFSTADVAAYTVSGTVAVSGGAGLANVSLVLTLGAGTGYRTVTDGSGNFTLGGIADGYYTLTPTLAGYAFVPNPRLVHVNGADTTGNVITAAPAGGGGSVTITL